MLARHHEPRGTIQPPCLPCGRVDGASRSNHLDKRWMTTRTGGSPLRGRSLRPRERQPLAESDWRRVRSTMTRRSGSLCGGQVPEDATDDPPSMTVTVVAQRCATIRAARMVSEVTIITMQQMLTKKRISIRQFSQEAFAPPGRLRDRGVSLLHSPVRGAPSLPPGQPSSPLAPGISLP